MEERHLNIKKVIATVTVFVFAFIIILASALITNNSKQNKEKNLSISELDETKNSTSSNNKDNIETDKENNKNSDKNIDKEFVNIKTVKRDLPVNNPNAIQLIKNIYFSDEKQIYLTFDDGPSPNITPQILDILKEEEVPATFFVLGSRVELYPNILKRVYNDGHYIANHGYSHKYSSIYNSVNSVVDEYNKTEFAIQNALELPEYHSYLFRFPGGSSGGPYDSLKAEAKSYLNNNGVATTNWNCLNGDSEANGKTREELIARLYETAEGHNSLVVLMHDANDKQTTVDSLKEIIQNYKDQGYVFKNFYEIFK